MEDSFIIKDVSEQPSASDSSATVAAHSKSSMPKSAGLIQLSTETSEAPQLELLWDQSTLLEPDSEDDLRRLKSGVDLKPKLSNSTTNSIDKLELDERIKRKFQYLEKPNQSSSDTSDLDEKV